MNLEKKTAPESLRIKDTIAEAEEKVEVNRKDLKRQVMTSNDKKTP